MLKLSIAAVLLAASCLAAELPICVSANDLAAQYAYDKTAANAKYKGKMLLVKGQVDHLRLGGREVDLKSEGLSLVRCAGADFRSLREGQQVTLKCKGDGTFGPITLSSCSIVPSQSACVEEKKPPIRPASPGFVQLTMTPQLQGQSVLISGTTNLKDGAVLNYEVEHELFQKQPQNNRFARGNIIVKGGRYSGTVNAVGWPRGKITVWVGFQTFVKEQPSWVRTQYGESGQKMEGLNVKLAGQGVKRAEVQKTLIKP